MKLPTIFISISFLLLLVPTNIFGFYKLDIRQSFNNSICEADIYVTTIGDAGPFDIYVYESLAHYNGNVFNQEFTSLPSGIQQLERIDATTYNRHPVIVIFDRLGCETVYQDISLGNKSREKKLPKTSRYNS